jgi:predicted 3-demethylubiquinone-9 3-methyltransferase (glyoxalase superfamily)
LDTEAEEAARHYCAIFDDARILSISRYGVSWQGVPAALAAMMNDPDSSRRERVMAALLQMRKLDIAALQRACDGD